MMASDVPTAVRMVKASAMASVGTMRKPPPTPKKPVTKPTAAPAMRSRGSRSGGQAPPLSQAPSRLGSCVVGLAPGGVRGGEHDQREAGEQQRRR